jgi:hypothetical protein
MSGGGAPAGPARGLPGPPAADVARAPVTHNGLTCDKRGARTGATPGMLSEWTAQAQGCCTT